MKDRLHNEEERRSTKVISGLYDLYDGEWLELDDEEQEFLYPISRMLSEVPKHYVDPVFVKAGGEKRIYKVRDLCADRTVALARPVEGATDEQKEEFLREARLTACLQHPNIISIYDIGVEANGDPFFIMEFIKGDTLKDIAKKLADDDPAYLQRFTLSRLLELFTKICDAVAYAHSRNVVHLDLKPANIFIGPFGEVLVCDWGLGKIIQNEEPVTLGGSPIPVEELPNGDILNDMTSRSIIKGTPGFMAPEQVGKQQKFSFSSDIYSLGALLYYMLTYRSPVPGDSLSEVTENTRKGLVVPLSKIRKNISRGLEAVVMKAIELKPDDRYISVINFRKELDRYLLGFATKAQQAGLFEQLMLLVRRRRFAFRVAMVSLVLLVAIIAAAFIKVVNEKEVAQKAQLRAEENLRLYKEETELSRALSDTIRETVMDLINAEDFLHAEGKIKAIESHLAQETDPAKVYELTQYIALLHFVLQDFNQASHYFKQIDVSKRYSGCAKLAEKYAKIKPVDGRWLEPEQMCSLLYEVKRHVRTVNYYLAYYYLKRSVKRPADELIPVVETVLDILNYQTFGEIQNHRLRVVKDDRGWHLSLSGSPYSLVQIPIAVPLYESNVLKPLRLYSLDLSYSAFSDIERLHGMTVSELNIAGMREIPRHKFFVFDRLEVKRVYHTLEKSDEFLKEMVPGVEFIRIVP